VLAQRNLDFHARIGIVAQHLGNRPIGFENLLGCSMISTITTCPDRLDLRFFVDRHQNILGNALVFRHHENHAVLDQHAADTRVLARSVTSTIPPSGRPLRSIPVTRTKARSPCSTLPI
jgi:hypothetical protein